MGRRCARRPGDCCARRAAGATDKSAFVSVVPSGHTINPSGMNRHPPHGFRKPHYPWLVGKVSGRGAAHCLPYRRKPSVQASPAAYEGGGGEPHALGLRGRQDHSTSATASAPTSDIEVGVPARTNCKAARCRIAQRVGHTVGRLRVVIYVAGKSSVAL